MMGKFVEATFGKDVETLTRALSPAPRAEGPAEKASSPAGKETETGAVSDEEKVESWPSLVETGAVKDRSCIQEARDANAFLIFAFGVLDAFHVTVKSCLGPVCGIAEMKLDARTWNETLKTSCPVTAPCQSDEAEFCQKEVDPERLAHCCCDPDLMKPGGIVNPNYKFKTPKAKPTLPFPTCGSARLNVLAQELMNWHGVGNALQAEGYFM